MKNPDSELIRNQGIDLLRIILSFNVIVIHLLNYGGPRTNASPSDLGFYLMWGWGLAINCAVNSFAIISGFVSYNKSFKYSSILRLYLTTLFHGLVITLLIALAFPGEIEPWNWFQALLPISTNEFWYFTAYCGLFVFMPLLVSGMRAITKKQATVLILTVIGAFSVLPTLSSVDMFGLQGGFSVLWIMAMFVLGMYLKKFYSSQKIKKRKLIFIYIISVAFTYIGMMGSLINPSFQGQRLMEYNSPTVVVAAITTVLFFSTVSCPMIIRKVADFCVPFTFSIYLIHDHPLVRRIFIYNCILPILEYAPLVQLIAVFGIAVLIWIGCFCLEYIRQAMFNLLGVNKLLHRINRRCYGGGD